jgi:hypothetical protein
MQDKTHWLDQPRNVTHLYRGLWIVGLLLVAGDLVVHRHEGVAFAERLGFHAVYGFCACVALVLAAKLLRWVVMRPEHYYDR